MKLPRESVASSEENSNASQDHLLSNGAYHIINDTISARNAELVWVAAVSSLKLSS